MALKHGVLKIMPKNFKNNILYRRCVFLSKTRFQKFFTWFWNPPETTGHEPARTAVWIPPSTAGGDARENQSDNARLRSQTMSGGAKI
jgi:hypothetical protein